MTPEQELEQELSSLSPEELDQYEQDLQKGSQEEPAEELSVDEKLESEGFDVQNIEGEEMGFMESAVAGSVEGVPFLKDALSAGMAVAESSNEDFGERYNKNKAEWDKYLNEAEGENPVAFTLGDIGGGVGLPMGAGLKAATAFGAASGLSRSEDRDFTDLLVGGAIGFGGGIIGKGISKGISKFGEVFSKSGKKGALEAAGAITPKTRKAVNKHAETYLTKTGTKNDAVLSMADDVINAKALDGKPILKSPFQDPNITASRTMEAKKVVGKQIGDVLQEADGAPLKGEEIYDQIILGLGVDDAAIKSVESEGKRSVLLKIRQKIHKDFFSHNKSTKIGEKTITRQGELGEEIVSKVDEMADIPVFKDRTLKQLHKLKTELGDTLSAKARNAVKGGEGLSADEVALRENLGVLSDIISDNVEKSGISSKESFQVLNRKWRTLDIVQEMSDDVANKSFGGPYEHLKNAIATKGLIMGGISTTVGASRGAAAGISLAVNEVLNSPKTPAVLAVGFKKIGNFLAGNPNSEYAKKIMIAASLSSDDLRLAVDSVASRITLMESAVARTAEDVKNKSDYILPILDDENPELAKQLREAINIDDDTTIGAIMNGVSKLPGSKEFIAEGQGWDGKVYSAEEKAQLTGEVNSMDISLQQKLKHKKALQISGTIPQIEQEPERFLKYRERDKSKPSY